MRNRRSGIPFYILLALVLILLVTRWGRPLPEAESISTTDFLKHLNGGEVVTLTARGPEYKAILKDKSEVKTYSTNRDFYAFYIKDLVDKQELDFTEEEIPPLPWYIELLPTLLTVGVLVGIWYLFMSRTQGGGGKMANFGKSQAKLHKDEGDQVGFDDVAGLVEEKEELGEIVDFLKNPKKYIELGARIPKGVLLVGPPGTGKTYLSRAVAGEAGVPFYSISGSDFVEMFVGVGASRVRDLFAEAKKNSPCIIFIDEIDAVGRSRGAGLGGGHDEREQTLNQLLVEMDGFSTNEGIIIMAATNRPDILDPAILRPGRFDRRVHIGLPDVRGREEILQVHTRNKKLEPDVDLKAIAKTTVGFTPADLENLCNEAAILAARYRLSAISNEIFEEATIKVVAGPELKSKVVSEKERILTAYHEAGHAITSRLLPEEDDVHMITIVPRGAAGGFTAYLPEERSYHTKKSMEQKLISLLGGRAAEELVLYDISTGASSDIERATKIAKDMIMVYGMTEELGLIKYGEDSGDVFLGKDLGKSRNYSEETAAKIDLMVREIVGQAYAKSKKLLQDNIEVLHKLAEELLEFETIDGARFEEIFLRHTGQKETEPEIVKKVKEADQLVDKAIEEGQPIDEPEVLKKEIETEQTIAPDYESDEERDEE